MDRQRKAKPELTWPKAIGVLPGSGARMHALPEGFECYWIGSQARYRLKEENPKPKLSYTIVREPEYEVDMESIVGATKLSDCPGYEAEEGEDNIGYYSEHPPLLKPTVSYCDHSSNVRPSDFEETDEDDDSSSSSGTDSDAEDEDSSDSTLVPESGDSSESGSSARSDSTIVPDDEEEEFDWKVIRPPTYSRWTRVRISSISKEEKKAKLLAQSTEEDKAYPEYQLW